MATNRKSGFQLDWSRVRGAKSTACVVPDDAIVNVVSSFHIRFSLVLEHCILWCSQCFWICQQIRHEDYTLTLVFNRVLLSKALTASTKINSKEDEWFG